MPKLQPLPDKLTLFEWGKINPPLSDNTVPPDTPEMPSASAPVARLLQCPSRDPAFKYITWMELYYSQLGTETDQEELRKAQAITIGPDTVTIAGIKIERKNGGSIGEKAALDNREHVPTLAEWQSIIDALPGGASWKASLQKILGIDLHKNGYWAWDAEENTMKIIRISGVEGNRILNSKKPNDTSQKALIRPIVRGD